MALSEKVSASRLGSNSNACIRSLKREIARSALSAEAPSVTSQPDSSASAPRLAPPCRRRRRARSGRSLAASLTSSLASTPGTGFDLRGIAVFSVAADHSAQALGHQERHDDMDYDEARNRRHGDEVDVARSFVAAEHRGERLQLHRLPDGKPG